MNSASSASTLPPPPAAALRLSILGAGLIALAFAAPFIAAALGVAGMTAFRGGEDIARTLGSLLFLAVVAWLLTRGRSDTAKARARVVVGVILCALVGLQIAGAQAETQAAKSFVAEAVKFRDAQAAKFSKLGERFDQIDLSTVLTPEAMVVPANRAAALAVLANYRALLAERRALVQTYLLEFERFVNERAPSGDMRAGALAGMKGKRDATVQLYSSLDETQTELAATMERVLQWGASQTGRLQVRNGQLLFADAKQQQELQGLLARLTAAEERFNAVANSAQAAQRQAQSEMADQNRRADEFIRK